MQNINSDTNLKDVILQLESLQAVEGKMLKEQFHATFESIKPINILKSTFREAAASHDLREDIINTSVGLIVGFLSKKIFESTSHSPLKKLFGTAILFGITNLVAQNPETVRSFGKGFLNIIMRKSSERIHGIDN